MHADSLLGGVRRVDGHGRRLLSLQMLSGPEPGWRFDDAVRTLVDVAELLRVSAPVPAARADGRRADAVSAVLEHSYERGGATVEGLRNDDVDLEAVDDRLETVGSWVVVPLGSVAPYARNWPPVVGLLIARLETVREDFDRLARRLRSGRSGARRTRRCEAIVGMLETLSGVLRRVSADARYVRDRMAGEQEALLRTVESAATQLWRDENA